MRVIQPRIQHGNHNAVALICGGRTIENARIVHVHVVGDHLRFRRGVYVAHNQGGVGGEQPVDLFEIFGLNRNFKSAQHGIVFFAQSVIHARFVQRFNQAVTRRFRLLRRRARFARSYVLFYAALLIGRFVCVENGIGIHRNDHGYCLRVRYGIGQFVHDVFVEIVFYIRLNRSVKTRNGGRRGNRVTVGFRSERPENKPRNRPDAHRQR